MTHRQSISLRRVFEVVNGGTPTSESANWGGNVQWATPVDLGHFDGQLLGHTQRTLTPDGLRTGSAAVPAHSLILSTRAPIGYVSQTTSSTAFNQGCRGLVPRTADVDVRYYRYVLVSLRDALTAAGQGSTFVELSSEALASYRIPYPPRERQEAIASYLDTETARIDALIRTKQVLAERLLERRLAVTYTAVKGGLSDRPATWKETSVPWLPSMPEHWQEAALSLVARLGSGHTPSRDRPDWWQDCDIPWITTGEVSQMRDDRIEYIRDTREKISRLGLANSAAELHPAGTVVLCRTAASAGFSAIMGTDMATSQDIVTWTTGPLLEPRFLLLCLRAMRTDLLDRLAQGSTHKTIYMPDIRSIRIPLPPVSEQRQIVEGTWRQLHDIDRAAERLAEQQKLLQEHRQALITAAVTGELEIPGAA